MPKEIKKSYVLWDVIEACAALILLVLMSPLFVLCALMIKVTSHGPVFYSQDRVGKSNRIFRIQKFRSMVMDAEKKTGPILSTRFDSRVTFIGRFLRNTHLDELPQLINIIKGDMSFVGPRPERPEFVEKFVKEISDYNLRSLVKPGISGLAQVCCSYDATAEEKLRFDLIYVEHRRSVSLFLKIMVGTIEKLVFGRFNEKPVTIYNERPALGGHIFSTSEVRL